MTYDLKLATSLIMKQKLHHLNQRERKQLLERLAGILKNCDNVLFAYVYGSFVEGLPFHDIDIGIYISEVKREKATFYSLDLAQKLSSELKIPVEARVINFAPVTFLYHVIQGNLIFERNGEERTLLVERTIQKYFDITPIIRRAAKEAFTA